MFQNYFLISPQLHAAARRFQSKEDFQACGWGVLFLGVFMAKRKSTGKRLRFDVFSRDNFTCRYCGRQSDVVALHIDHVIPVCQGGTNDKENLITACCDCNHGKAGRTPTQAAPTESDRLRLAQERNEQIQSFVVAREAMESRNKLKQLLREYWMESTGRDRYDESTLSVIFKYVEENGLAPVLQWIDKAAARFSYCDRKMGRYISGIRRKTKEGELS